ncbi:hypothetical protein CYMTET_28034 [Cymbomonas tetramitiformis]|uniref:DUF155 domain-containing protein n=1 Tax=Cymbomonas tetramitiformis TaxID=36881 RepID=A0AAE0KWB7_9CHLO|nr:hypothetical protein CYMTET_28034 [Cymbomonas tetramitiformis]
MWRLRQQQYSSYVGTITSIVSPKIKASNSFFAISGHAPFKSPYPSHRYSSLNSTQKESSYFKSRPQTSWIRATDVSFHLSPSQDASYSKTLEAQWKFDSTSPPGIARQFHSSSLLSSVGRDTKDVCKDDRENLDRVPEIGAQDIHPVYQHQDEGYGDHFVPYRSDATFQLTGEARLPVKAFHIGESIDINALSEFYHTRPQSLSRDSLLVILPDVTVSPPRFIMVFKYGSLVCFNLHPEDIREIIVETRLRAFGAFNEMHSDDYWIVLQPALSTWSVFKGDYVILKRLDVQNIRVVGNVLGQTVALYHYELKVDTMLELFSQLNSKMEATGNISMSKANLFQLVASLNKMMVDVITKLGLLRRSDTAWKYAQYGQVLEGMRHEFELKDRFDSLHYKLELIITQAQFYMEMMQHNRSDALEWTIIILIMGEIAVSVYDMATRI